VEQLELLLEKILEITGININFYSWSIEQEDLLETRSSKVTLQIHLNYHLPPKLKAANLNENKSQIHYKTYSFIPF
jgi:hypothetical protein